MLVSWESEGIQASVIQINIPLLSQRLSLYGGGERLSSNAFLISTWAPSCPAAVCRAESPSCPRSQLHVHEISMVLIICTNP